MTRSRMLGILSVATERPIGGGEATMSDLKIYGVPLSRAYRALWMANELGLDYENVPIHFADGSAKTPEYLAVNPNGRIPAIDDNGFKLGIHGHQSLSRQEARQRLVAEGNGGRGAGDPMELLGDDRAGDTGAGGAAPSIFPA